MRTASEQAPQALRSVSTRAREIKSAPGEMQVRGPSSRPRTSWGVGLRGRARHLQVAVDRPPIASPIGSNELERIAISLADNDLNVLGVLIRREERL